MYQDASKPFIYTSWYPRPGASSPLLPPSEESKGPLLWFSCFPCLLRCLSFLGWGCLIFSTLWEGGGIYGRSVGLPIEYDRPPKAASMIRARFAYISQITNLNEFSVWPCNLTLKGPLRSSVLVSLKSQCRLTPNVVFWNSIVFKLRNYMIFRAWPWTMTL